MEDTAVMVELLEAIRHNSFWMVVLLIIIALRCGD